ncbi:PiggyBac transposable element-derived protein 2 [Anabarilius grahami]|uniref:PiggyBac transposable element-derived protein 2 n=1 Tax=Anabarilius grahami TaxID=495550 RepID=A0A3N0YHW4_ANAGA|nr:PiggyBac transposable element-derived protein 2 [Anabarilius grahami]
MAGRRKFYSASEVIEYICLPDGALSDTESIPDDNIADPDFEESPEAYESDSSFDDDKPLAAIPKANLNHLDVEIQNIHADSDTEVPDDNEPQPGPAPVNKEFSWRQRKPPATDIDSSFRGPAFSPPPDEIPSPKWYFDQFMDKSVFEHISNQSNLYAVMKNGPELKTTPSEIEQFIGLHILMTVVRMPSYRMYWQTATRYDPIATVMGRKRFDNLRTYIHMNDNTNVKQKGTVTNERGLGVAGEVVLRLVSEVPKGLNYKCFFDNWFTSPELIVELKKMGILTVATINRNRLRGCTLKSDKELSKAGRGAYEVKYEKTSGMSIVKWYDNKAVLLASSFIGPEPVERCRRWSKEKKEHVEVDRPHIVKANTLNNTFYRSQHARESQNKREHEREKGGQTSELALCPRCQVLSSSGRGGQERGRGGGAATVEGRGPRCFGYSDSARLLSTSLLVRALCSGLMRELKGVQLSAVYGAEKRMILNVQGAFLSRASLGHERTYCF